LEVLSAINVSFQQFAKAPAHCRQAMRIGMAGTFTMKEIRLITMNY
jgi:hypothetical protein